MKQSDARWFPIHGGFVKKRGKSGGGKGKGPGNTPTTTIGYVNRNKQTVLRATGKPGNDHGQYIYVLKCGACKAEYGANGSDIFQRKCPKCGGGKPGLR